MAGEVALAVDQHHPAAGGGFGEGVSGEPGGFAGAGQAEHVQVVPRVGHLQPHRGRAGWVSDGGAEGFAGGAGGMSGRDEREPPPVSSCRGRRGGGARSDTGRSRLGWVRSSRVSSSVGR